MPRPTKWALFEKHTDIYSIDEPLKLARRRWRILATPWFGIYLHEWFAPDDRTDLHNHPWSFFSIILRGAYMEHRFDKHRIKLVRSFNWVPSHVYHNVAAVDQNTLSLMFVGPDKGTWGYLVNLEHVPYDEHPYNDKFIKAKEIREGDIG